MKTRFVSVTLFLLLILSALSAPVLAKDTWINVRSKNFFLIGNASEKEIRGVATKLEQFRDTFRKLFPRNKFDSHIQTNVVVFKSASSYKPFKPKRADGKADEWIAGYFQPGEDVNYITLSTEGEKADVYGTIFHEYVHFMLDTHFGKSEVPPWFNEGLAEYYQTFSIEDDQKVLLGNIQDNHLLLLQQTKLIPLKTFFAIDNYSLHQNGNHSRSIFYAQAWALVHYLIQGNNGANGENLSKFLALIMNKVEPEKAFQQVFGYSYATMEEALKKYVTQRTFRAMMYTAKEKMVFDTEMTVSPLSETEANAYLGDLLYHTQEYTDAETYLQRALTAEPNMSMANTSMGLVRWRQNKFNESKTYLEKAIASGHNNYYAHYTYAYVMSREGRDEFGYTSGYPAETSKKMREALQKAIQLNPNYSDSYGLLAYVSMINNENLDEALNYLKKGIAVQPGDQQNILYLAEIYMRQQKYKEAKEIAQNLLKTASETEIHSQAQRVLDYIARNESIAARNEELKKQYEKSGGRPIIITGNGPVSEEQLKKIREESRSRFLNQQLPKLQDGETRSLGYVQKVSCAGGAVSFTVRIGDHPMMLASKDFASLELMSLTPESESIQVGCTLNIPDVLTVIGYRAGKDPKAKGTLLSLSFVPKDFKLKSAEEMEKDKQELENDPAGENAGYVVEEVPESASGGPPTAADIEEARRKALLKFIAENLRKPLADEKRETGTLEKIECVKDKVFFLVKLGTQALKLRITDPNSLYLKSYTPDAAQFRLGCGAVPPYANAVITFRPNADPKAKDNGEIIGIEYVPKSFTLK